MEKIKREGITVILPEIVLPEVSSAIARGTGDSHMALEFVEDLKNISNFVFIPIEREISDLSAKFAAYNKIRGYDSVYVAVSYIFGVCGTILGIGVVDHVIIGFLEHVSLKDKRLIPIP